MAPVQWASAADGSWTVGANWDSGNVPLAGDDVLISVAGPYTVSLTQAVVAASVTIGDAAAVLQIQDPGGNDAFSGNFDNGGTVDLDTGGAGGSTLTIGGTLTSSNDLRIGSAGMTVADLLTVEGSFANTGGLVLVGGQGGGAAWMVVDGAAQATLTGNTSITGNAGGARLQYGSGGITQIGDGASNGGGLLIDGADAVVAVGTGDGNSALTGLATIAGNGLLDLRDGATVSTAGALTVQSGGRLKIDAYGGHGGSMVTVGGDLSNFSSGSYGDGGVSVGSAGMSTSDLLTVDGTFDNTGGLLEVVGGQTGAAAGMVVDGALSATLTGNYSIVGNAGGASLQYGSGGISQIGDGAGNGGDLYIDGADAFAEVGATDSNSALTGLATIEGNGLLDLRDGTTVNTAGTLAVESGGRLKIDAYGGRGGSAVTIGGDLSNDSSGSYGDGGVSVGSAGMSTADRLTVDGTFDNTGGLLEVVGGQTGAAAQMVVGGAAQATLTGNYSIVGNAGGASLLYTSGGITQIGDGAGNGGDLYIDGADAFAEIGTTGNNSALTNLATIADNGVLDLRDGTAVSTAGALTVQSGGGRLKIDAYGGRGGSAVTIGGDLSNGSSGSFGDGGVSVGSANMSTADLLTVDGTLDNTGGLLNLVGGQTGAAAGMVVHGALSAILTGDYSITGNAGGASLQYASGGITQIGDGAGNGGELYIDGADAFAEIGATDSNSALTGLATIEGNGELDLRDGATVSTTGALTVESGGGRLKVDAYGGRGGGMVTIGGNLTNNSFGSFNDGGVSVGNINMSTADLLTVNGTFDNTDGSFDVIGGQTGAAAGMVVDGALSATLTGTYSVTGNAGGASLQYASGGITRIGDGAGNGGDLLIDGADAFAEIGATDSNSALTGLATIEGNGELDLRDGTTVNTTGALTVEGGDGRLKVDAYGGRGGGMVTIGGDLTNNSFGSFNDGGVSVGNIYMSTADVLTVDGTFDNTGGSFDVIGGQTGAAAGMVVDGALAATLTGTYSITGNVGGASLQYGSGGITEIGDGASNGGELYIDGADAFAEIGATDSNSALTGLATIEGNGELDLRDGTTVSTTGALTVEGGDGRLKVDAYGGTGGGMVTIGGDLTNNSFGSFNDGGVSVGNVYMSVADLLTIEGTVDNTGLFDVTGNSGGTAVQAVADVHGSFDNSGVVKIDANGLLELAGTDVYAQTADTTEIAGTLSAHGVTLAGGVIDLLGGSLDGAALGIANGATLLGYGTVTSAISSAGSIEASGGSLDLAGGLAIPAAIAIENAAALELAGPDSGDVAFAGASGIFVLDQPADFTGEITGLAVGDTLLLRNVQASGASTTFDSGTDTSTLAVVLAGGGTLDFTLAGNYAGEAFGVNPVGSDSEIAAVGAAVGVINTPTPIALGAVRSGAADSVALSITNNAPTGSAALDVTVAAVAGGATASGSIEVLVPGATDTSDISVGLNTGIAGALTGTVTLGFASDLGGGNTALLPGETVTVSGDVYREAVARTTPLELYVHVGDAGVETLGVANLATADGFSESLIAGLTGATGGFTIAGSASTGDIPAGGSDAASLTLDYSTAQAGIVSGDAMLSLVSDGGTIDGLGTIALPSQAVPISVSIDNYATAELQPPTNVGTLSASGATATLDLGTVAEGTGNWAIAFGVANSASGPADLLSGSFAATAAAGFSLGGLASFSGLAAGQADNAAVTLDTATGGVVSQTITLTPTDSNPGGYSAALAPQTLTITGTVEALPSPSIAAAATLTAMTDVPTLLGLSIADPNTDTLQLTVTITDTSGALLANAVGSGTVSGDGSNTLVLTGDVGDLNDELAAVAYGGAVVGADTVNVVVADQHHASATRSIAVGVAPVPFTLPVFNSPTNEMVVVDNDSGYGGLSVSDPAAEASGQPITVVFSSEVGTLSVTGDYGGTVLGQGTGTLAITGSVEQVNAYLGDGMLEDIGDALVEDAFDFSVDKTIGFIKTGTIDLLPTEEDIIKLGGGPEGKFFEVGVVSATYAIDSLLGLIPGNAAPSQAEFIKALVEIVGDPHIVGANGALYDFNAEGEFVLAAATDPGDSFDVQVRLQSFDNSAYASVVTQAAAAVGTDRVTFATGRADAIWVDGTAATLEVGGSIELSGGEVTEVSADSYRVTWNTGEVLNVTVAGGFLDLSIAPGPNNTVGSLVGLATLADTPADEFQLVDGTTLDSPLSSETMYGAFADAWRVPQADSLLDYAAGQTTATFTDTGFPAADVTLADLPAGIVAQAAAVVAAAGITDPGAAAAIEFDYIVSGGDPAIVAADASYLAGVSTTPEQATPIGPAPVTIGVIADQPAVVGDNAAATPVVFDVYLTAASSTAETIDYAVVATSAGELGAAAFGGSLPSGKVSIAAGDLTGQFTIDVPAGGLGLVADSVLAVEVSATDGTAVFAPTAQATIVQAIPGPQAVPVIADLTNIGSFTVNGDSYLLDLGDVQYGEPLPAIQFAIENTTAAPSDALGGSFSVAPVEGFTVSGASLPAPLDGDSSYKNLDVAVNSVKFGANSETITFDPTDSNITGYSANLAPITLTIEDTIVPPTMVFSYAWGDVHIITYNGLDYNFQGEGEFTLAHSRVPGDSFDIQMRLQPLSAGASVTWITQAALGVGTDKVTFDGTRPDTVWVDGAPSTVSQGDPVVNLDGGKLVEISSAVWQVTWDTGEEATITQTGPGFDISDGIPLSEPDQVGGLQGEDAGAANDFQLSDGTVLPQPLTSSELYGEFANSWRVTQTSSLFDYLPGQNTSTFTDVDFPADNVSLADLPPGLVAAASTLVAAAGITDPGLVAAAELDYIVSGDPGIIGETQQIATQVTSTTPVIVQPSTAPVPAVGVDANPPGYTEAASGPTPVILDAYLTTAATVDVAVDYTVVAAGAGYFDAADFGGTLPSGTLTIAAGSTLEGFTIDLPQDVLGTLASEDLEVQVTAPGGSPVFAPTAIATVANNTPEAGTAPIPQLLELSHLGTLSESSATSYTLDLGSMIQGATSSQIQLALGNTASPPADALSGTFAAPTGNGFLVIGDSLPGAIIAGGEYGGLYVAPLTAAAGQHSETLVFDARDVNDSGYEAALAPISLTIIDTVTAPGVGQLDTPQTIVFPNVHVGTPESQALVVSNTGAAPIEVAVSAADPIIAQGTIASLAAGATDTTDLSVGVDTSSGGAMSGMVDVDFGSSDPVIDAFGDVYRLASGTVSLVSDIVHVGAAGTVAIAVGNAATADGFSENLLATLAGVSGAVSIGAAGPTGEIAAGSSDSSSLLLDFSTAQAGTISGSATLDLTSDGGTIDGLGTTALAAQTLPVDITVDNYASPVFENLSGIGTLSGSSTAATLDLGSVAQAAGSLVVDLGVLNDVAGPSDLLSGSLQAGVSDGFVTNGLASFADLAAGQADVAPTVTLSTGTPGVFSQTITLAASGSNASGYSSAFAAETLTVTGTVSAGVQPPTITGTVAGQAATDHAGLDPFATVVIGDPNVGRTEAVTVTPTVPGDGVLSDPDGGSVDPSTGVYTVTGTAAAVSAAVDALVFTPTLHQVAPGQSVTTGFTVSVNDGLATAADSATTVIATAQNDPPVVVLPAGGLHAGTSGATAILAGSTITDPDVGQTQTLTVSLADPALGVLSDPDAGSDGSSVDPTTGALTASGTPAQVTAILDGLLLTPNTVGSGQPVSTEVTVADSDGEATTTQNEVLTLPTSNVFLWAQPVSGLYTTAANWLVLGQPATVAPVIGDIVEFATGSASPYTTSAGGMASQAQVLGDRVTYTGTLALAGAAAPMGSGTVDLLIDGGGSLDIADGIVGGTGAVSVGDAGAAALSLTDGSILVTGGLTIDAQGTFSIDNTATLQGGLILDGGSLDGSGTLDGAITVAASSFVNASGSLFLGGTIGGSGGLILHGEVTLDGNGAGRTGATELDNAELTVAAAGAAGSGPIVTDAGSANMIDLVAGAATIFGGGADTIRAFGSSALIVGSTGTVTNGSGTLIDFGAGASTVIGGSGRVAALAGPGGGLFEGGSAGGNVLAAGTGPTTLVGSGSGDALFGGTGSTVLLAGAGNETLVGYAGSETLTGGSGIDDMFGGSGPTTVAGSANGIDIMVGGSGPTVLEGGSGTNYMWAGGGSTTIMAGSGSQVLGAGSGSTTMIGGDTTVTFLGGSGSSLVETGGGNDTVWAGGQMNVHEGSGKVQVVGEAGQTTVAGGSGTDLYIFIDGIGGGSEMISGFKPGQDQILLFDYGANPDVQQHVSGNALVLTLPDGTGVTLAGLTSLPAGAII